MWVGGASRRRADRGGRHRFGLGHRIREQSSFDALKELSRAVMTSVSQQLVSCRNLQDGAHVTPGPHRNHQLPDGDAEDAMEAVVDAHPVELRGFDELAKQIEILFVFDQLK